MLMKIQKEVLFLLFIIAEAATLGNVRKIFQFNPKIKQKCSTHTPDIWMAINAVQWHVALSSAWTVILQLRL